MRILGVRLLGVSAAGLHKLLLTLALVAILLLFRKLVVGGVRLVSGRAENERLVFWTRQGSSLAVAVILVLGFVSIWFDNPARAMTPLGIVTAGLAVALQRVWTAIAGYFVLLRGKLFTVGDRIAIGGVRGDVLSMGFLYTRVMEMGQPPPVQEAQPAVWVAARQYTGRIVTVTNDKVFEVPVYNYTREFPFLYEEIHVPIKYGADRKRAEEILLAAAEPSTRDVRAMSAEARQRLEQEYFLDIDELTPRVYYRLTDNWLELTLRFVARPHGVRDVKDRISRAILDALEAAGIEIASATFEVVGLPPLRAQVTTSAADRTRAGAEQSPAPRS